MKKRSKINLRILITLLVVLVASCKKDEKLHADLSALDRSVITNTALDTWLDANYLTPYNIQVKYRFDPYEADLSKDLTPVIEDQVQPAMQAIKDIWISPYEATGGPTFMKANTPKQIYLVGSPSINEDGTITLGIAEGGKKIVLYELNYFSISDIPGTLEMMHVIHHEFTHILNQKIPYDPGFGLVTFADYTANWNLNDEPTARSLGFISQYSRSSALEDFAEMVSRMLTYGKPQYDFIVNALPADPQAKIRKKEQYVVSYFKTAWNIDFYALQAAVANAVNTATSAPASLLSVTGTGKTYTTFVSNPDSERQSPAFLALWNTAKTNMTTAGFTLNQYQLIFGANNLVTLRYNYTSGTTSTNADVDLTLSTDATGISTLALKAVQPTGGNYTRYNTIKTPVQGITNYITGTQFKIAYPPQSIYGIPGAIGVLTKATDVTSYLIGTLN